MPRYTKKIAALRVGMENLPGDVLSNIFICLLAKQLAQMRCVCKFWNALLSDSKFVNSHLHRTIHNNKDDILLFFKKGGTIHSGPATARPSCSPDVELTNFIKLKPPVEDPQHQEALGQVIGSVNGLICFAYASNHDCLIRIWNPSLSATLTLPPSDFPCIGVLAFGFDPKTDDYKVVRIACDFDKFSMQPQGEVYSMRNGSWELMSHSIPSHIKYIIYHNEVCLDGHIHWLCVTYLERKPQTILTFDLGAMTFGEIHLPDFIIDFHGWCINELGVLGGKLCLMSRVQDGNKCEVWVMGDDKLWVKHHVFSQFSCRITPYGFTSRMEFLYKLDDYRFALYDQVADKSKIFKIKYRERWDKYKIFEYVDSLVWIAPASQLKLAA